MKFLLIASYPEQAQPRQPPKAMTDAMEVLLADGFSKGWLKDTGGLKPTKDAVRIRAKGGKLTVIDGPFTEAKRSSAATPSSKPRPGKKRSKSRYASWSSVALTTLISSTRARSYRWKRHSISATDLRGPAVLRLRLGIGSAIDGCSAAPAYAGRARLSV